MDITVGGDLVELCDQIVSYTCKRVSNFETVRSYDCLNLIIKRKDCSKDVE